jgi:hypothetical protein
VKAQQMLAISMVLLASLSLQGKVQSPASPDKPSKTHTGKLQGRITNTSGEAVKDATIVLTDTSTREENRTKTDGEGTYKFNGLFPGSYRVSAEAKGYKPSFAETLIKNDSLATVDLHLANE